MFDRRRALTPEPVERVNVNSAMKTNMITGTRYYMCTSAVRIATQKMKASTVASRIIAHSV